MTQRPSGGVTPTRVLVLIANALGNLVTVTLRHGCYETQHALSDNEIASAMRDWDPQLALIDIDHFPKGIEQVGGGMAKGGIPILAFTRRRETKVKLATYEEGADDMIEVPFTLDEIVTRPFALIRRSRGVTVKIVAKRFFSLKGFSLTSTPSSHTCGRSGEPARSRTVPLAQCSPKIRPLNQLCRQQADSWRSNSKYCP